MVVSCYFDQHSKAAMCPLQQALQRITQRRVTVSCHMLVAVVGCEAANKFYTVYWHIERDLTLEDRVKAQDIERMVIEIIPHPQSF